MYIAVAIIFEKNMNMSIAITAVQQPLAVGCVDLIENTVIQTI